MTFEIFPILLDNSKIQQEKADYLHNNPVEAEIVDEPENYWYSSSRNYAGRWSFGSGTIGMSLRYR